MILCLCCTVQAREGGQMTAVTTKTANVHGDELFVTTTSPYEQVGAGWLCDWVIKGLALIAGDIVPILLSTVHL